MDGLTLQTMDIIDPDLYVRRGYPHEEWALLRRAAPVFRYERANVIPFWAVTRHADIIAISRNPALFRSAQYLFVSVTEPNGLEDEVVLRQLLNMNPPEHGAYRSVVNRRFTPRSVQKLAAQVEEVTVEVLDAIGDRGECDFVTEVSAKLPLAVIAEMFGIPRSDWDLMFRLSNSMIAPSDPEFAGTQSVRELVEKTRLEFFQYFSQLIEDRRKSPATTWPARWPTARSAGTRCLPLSYFLILLY